MRIRQAGSTDVVAVERCVCRAYQGYVMDMGRKPAPMLDNYHKLIGRRVVHLAHDGNSILGLIVMWPRANDDRSAPPDRHLYVDNIAVDPDQQGNGVGSELLRFAEQQAVADGLAEIRLYTNEAMAHNEGYYPRRGFVETHRGEDQGYRRIYYSRRLVLPRGDQPDGVPASWH